MTPELILFFALAAVAVASAVMMLLSRNAVHSALYLVANFAVVAVFFLLLGAPFIAMAQVTVYAGAIMVLFLFVIMLLGAEMLRQPGQALPWQVPAAVFLFVVFLGIAGLVLAPQVFAGAPPPAVDPDALGQFGGPQSIGEVLFNQYLLPFELTSFLLLVGMIGAVVLTRDDKAKTSNSKPQTPKG
jgi:NADH-quinone oxidoreductase subunit J